MNAPAADEKHEIVIIKRGGHDDHDDHHGGAWKIAFADFMTAMMCFFLVMWLINAANEQTKAAVASYFNPIKLTDRNASRKGLDDIGEGPVEVSDSSSEMTESKKAGSERKPGEDTSNSSEYTDEHLFSDPYAVLAEIAQDSGTMKNISAKGDGGAQDSGPATGASGGESFRDPFAPDFWSKEIAPVETGPVELDGEDAADEPQPDTESKVAKVEAVEPPPPVEPVKSEAPPSEAQPQPPAEMAAAAPPEPFTPPAPAQPEAEKMAAAEADANEIREALQKALSPESKLQDGISVEATKEGIVISVTEQLPFGMFEVGSAVPRRDLVLAMEKIGKVLSSERGRIRVNGHTDARPYAGQSYDNWRLSTARAHSTYYMLVRGGLEERRISEVAGFADRKLKVPGDPYAAANRRIEILLEYPEG